MAGNNIAIVKSVASERGAFFSSYKPELDDKQNLTKLTKKATTINSKSVYAALADFEVEAELLKKIFETNRKEKDCEAQTKSCAFMLYYVTEILRNYYQDAGNHKKLANYTGTIEELKIYFGIQDAETKAEQTVLEWMSESAKENYQSVIDSLKHTSDLRNNVSMVNIYRIYWVFCRFVVMQSVAVAKNYHLQEYLAKWLNHPVDFDKFVKILAVPQVVLNVLSVGFYALRILIDVGMIIKHSFVPGKKEADIDRGVRAWSEIKKRSPDIVNNLVWGTINLLTNYTKILNITDAVALQIIAPVLIFDISFNYFNHHMAKSNYEKQLARLKGDLSNNSNEAPLSTAERKLIRLEILALKDDWQVNKNINLFNVSAATLLCVSFGASLLVASPALILTCYLASTLAVAMYMSNGEFGAYSHAANKLKLAKDPSRSTCSDKVKTLCESELRDARWNLSLGLAEKIFVPPLTLLTFTVSWQVGIIVLAGYLAYKLHRAYNQRNNNGAGVDIKPYQFLNGPESNASEEDNEQGDDTVSTPLLPSQ